MPVTGWMERRGNKMGAADIVIHRGDKEEKYQLYVEDYVMSYLKNYGATEGGRIFFYGKREQKKKYYIYGAGRERALSCFDNYVFLEEITCRISSDMPVFSVTKDSETYELQGYDIFYQSNEAMQNYMVEQRKIAQDKERAQDGNGKRMQNGTGAKISRPQNINRPQSMNRAQGADRPQMTSDMQREGRPRNGKALFRKTAAGNKMPEKTGIMAVQLTAIFIILIAIVINSTNSYTKLEELNEAAVEVFFAMENEDAVEAESEKSTEDEKDADGTVLRLEDLNAKLEEENQAAMSEETDEADADSAQKEDTKGEGTEEESAGNMEKKDEEGASGEGNKAKEEEAGGGNKVKEDGAGDENKEEESGAGDENKAEESENGDKNKVEEDEAGGENHTKEGGNGAEEAVQSEQAFARNFAEYYKIEKGDTLYKISIKIYGDTGKVKEICELNEIKDPDNIKYGQKILLP